MQLTLADLFNQAGLPLLYAFVGFAVAWYLLRKLSTGGTLNTGNADAKKTIIDIIDYVVLQAVKAAEQAWKVDSTLDRETFALNMVFELLKQFDVAEPDIPAVDAIKKLIYSKVLGLPKSNP